MNMKGCVKGVSAPSHKAVGFDFDDVKAYKSGKSAQLSKGQSETASQMKGGRAVLTELQEEAKQLLSLTYGLSVTASGPTASAADSASIPTKPTKSTTSAIPAMSTMSTMPAASTQAPWSPLKSDAGKTVLDAPKLSVDSQTMDAINSKWQREYPSSKDCKLIPGPDRCKPSMTDKMFNTVSAPKLRTRTCDIESVDVIAPVRHLEKPLNYPLDLSVSDFSSSAPLLANATRESYREMLVSLQQKYTVILRMFEEINEQRMSYVEGIRELQGHLDNSRSVMQLQKAEIGKLRGCIENHEATARLAAKELDRSREVVAEHIRHEDELESVIREKEEHIDGLKVELDSVKASVDALHAQMKDMSYMPRIPGNDAFSDVKFTYSDAMSELSDLISALSDPSATESQLDSLISSKLQGTGPLRYLELLTGNAFTGRLAEFSRQRFMMADKFQRDLLVMRENKEKEMERNYEITQQLVDTYAARVLQANAENLWVRNLLNKFAKRASCLAANVDSNSKISEKIEKQLRLPMPVMVFDKPVVGRASFREMRIRVVNGVVQIGRIKGDAFVPKMTVSGRDIHRFDYGFKSSSYIMHRGAASGFVAYPWHFFSIATESREYHFVCTTDMLLDVLVIGLNRMIFAQRFMVDLIDISRLRIVRAKMKLHYYCIKHNISHRRMWLNAIRKTAAQLNAR